MPFVYVATFTTIINKRTMTKRHIWTYKGLLITELAFLYALIVGV